MSVVADAKAVAKLTLPELRIALRARGLSPAGARATLVERLLAGLQMGCEPVVVVAPQHASGCGSEALSASYARADGGLPEDGGFTGKARFAGEAAPDGVGVLLTRPPDGAPPPSPGPAPAALSAPAVAQAASSVFEEEGAVPVGGEGVQAAHVHVPHPSRVKDLAGHGIFTPIPQPVVPWSDLKKARPLA